MKKIRTWQLCRTGKFGADGATITEQDLREIQETFAPPRPVTVGHDGAMGDRFPKFGDVLYIDGIYPGPAKCVYYLKKELKRRQNGLQTDSGKD